MMARCAASLAVLLSGTAALTTDMGHGWNFFGKARKEPAKVLPHRDLAFMHVPATHGHTVEKVAMFRPNATKQDMVALLSGKGSTLERTNTPLTWSDVRAVARETDAEIWGRMSPQLQWASEITGCNLYDTPQKYWPERNAKRYFRNLTIFGVLRDPYERLVAHFRANPDGFDGKYGKLRDRCDVNSAIKQMMNWYLEKGDVFMESCALIPQAEYFEGHYGIKLPVDGRKFPESMNSLFRDHGYEKMQIRTEDIIASKECPNAWAGDLDRQTKKMVREVYAHDFELICKHFGYCNSWESTCAMGVPDLCPKKVAAQLQLQRYWGAELKRRA